MRFAVILACTVALVGCTSEGDLQLRWIEELGTPAGVKDITTFSCKEPLPGSNLGCQLSLAVERDVDADEVAGIVEAYVETAEDVYGSEDVDASIGLLHLDAHPQRRYVFDPTAADGEPDDRRTEVDAAAVEFWLGTFDDRRFKRVTVNDLDDRGADAIIDLPANDPNEVMVLAGRMVVEFDELSGATLRADVPGEPGAGIVDLSLRIEDSQVPATEWAYVTTVAERESESSFRVDISPGRVHLVVRGAGNLEDPEAARRMERLRSRTVAAAPQGISVTVGSRSDG